MGTTKIKTQSFEELKKTISELGENDKALISVSIMRDRRVDSMIAANNFPTNDLHIARGHVSEMIHVMYEGEIEKEYDATDERVANEPANKIKSMLE